MPSGIAHTYKDHPGLQWMAATPQHAQWLEDLDDVAAAVARELKLSLFDAYEHAYAGIAIRAQTVDGTSVVLKLCAPDDEGFVESEALVAWGGRGSVRLLAEQPDRGALLLEAIAPGTALSDADPDTALSVLCACAHQLTVPAPSTVPAIGPVASRWHTTISSSVEKAVALVGELVANDTLSLLSQHHEQRFVVNLDLQATNVVWSATRGWLVIDPKAVAGPRALACSSIIRSRELALDRSAIIDRLERTANALNVSIDDAARWAIAQSLAWGLDGVDDDQMHDDANVVVAHTLATIIDTGFTRRSK